MSVKLKFGENEKMPHSSNAGIAINSAKCQEGFAAELGCGDMALIVEDAEPAG